MENDWKGNAQTSVNSNKDETDQRNDDGKYLRNTILKYDENGINEVTWIENCHDQNWIISSSNILSYSIYFISVLLWNQHFEIRQNVKIMWNKSQKKRKKKNSEAKRSKKLCVFEWNGMIDGRKRLEKDTRWRRWHTNKEQSP